MAYLLIVSFIWAFSFGLIKGHLTGLDSNLVSWARMMISLLVFLPFLRIKRLSGKVVFQFILIGTLQYGLMYMTYILSYQFLPAYQVALFTIFTPLYVTWLNDLFRKEFNSTNLLAASIAVVGTGIIVFRQAGTTNLIRGFLLMQVSNLCFAFGQIYYRELMKKTNSVKDYQVFGLLYLGAVVITSVATGFTTNWGALHITQTQVFTLLYLGILASGLCFFWWNLGARKVNGGTLAVFNNLKIPLAIAVSFLIFHEQSNLPRLLVGGFLVILALFISEKIKFAKTTGSR